MSARHIVKHYGFGAARIPVRAEMHCVSDAGFGEDFAAILAEAGSGGPAAVFRRFAGTAAGLATISAFLVVVIAGLVSQEASREALEVVMLESAEVVPPPIVEPLVELPAPPEPVVPEAVKPEPEVVKPAPEPPPMVAEVKPEPPKATPIKPEPIRIEPEIAKVQPPPVQRIERPVRERPVPVSKPRVAIEAVAVAPDLPANRPAPERMARAAVRPEARALPRMAAPAAPAIDVPNEAPDRSFRVAAARAPGAARGRAIVGVAPAAFEAPALDAPSVRSSAPTRGAAPARPTAATGPARPMPRFEMAAAPTAPSARALEVPSGGARAERSTPPPGGTASGGGSSRPGLSGVPLGELSACVTDQEEDRLKQAVVAAVKAQSECVSSKGTYRFVETKNLNAFLMWIDRASSRRVEDRCAELRYALECLQGASRRASR